LSSQIVGRRLREKAGQSRAGRPELSTFANWTCDSLSRLRVSGNP